MKVKADFKNILGVSFTMNDVQFFFEPVSRAILENDGLFIFGLNGHLKVENINWLDKKKQDNFIIYTGQTPNGYFELIINNI